MTLHLTLEDFANGYPVLPKKEKTEKTTVSITEGNIEEKIKKLKNTNDELTEFILHGEASDSDFRTFFEALEENKEVLKRMEEELVEQQKI